MGSTPVACELLAIGELAPGRIALEFRAPNLIAALRPGHALHLVRPESGGYRVRRVAPVSRVDLLRGSVEVALQPRADGGQDALAGLRIGEVIELIGPIGQPILINKATMRLLLIADGEGFAWVRALAIAATSAGISVTMLQQAETGGDLPPASLLPDVVEIVVATSDGSIGHRGTVADLLAEYVSWADQARVATVQPPQAPMPQPISCASRAWSHGARLPDGAVRVRAGLPLAVVRSAVRRRSAAEVAAARRSAPPATTA